MLTDEQRENIEQQIEDDAQEIYERNRFGQGDRATKWNQTRIQFLRDRIYRNERMLEELS